VFKKNVLRKKEVKREWTKIYSKELHTLYASNKKDEMAGTCSTPIFHLSISVGNPEGKEKFGRPSYNIKDHITTDLKERVCGLNKG
jgi:hypothetical protein